MCGSGKKYKRCCLIKEQSGSSENKAKQQEERDRDDSWFWLMNNLRRLTLDRKPHIKQYYKTKKLHGEILGSMMKHYDDGKFEQKFDREHSPPKRRDSRDPAVVYLVESSFDMETEIGAEGLYDVVVYKSAPNANCITEEFIKSNRYRKPEKIEFLNCMLNSRLGLFEVAETYFDEGTALLKEVFTGDEYKITDVGLSGNQNADFYIYTRIITYQGVSFCAGLNFIFSKTDEFIKNHIRYHEKDYNSDSEFLRFCQLYNQYSKFPDKIKVVTNKIKK
jgi:hypothetical protein